MKEYTDSMFWNFNLQICFSLLLILVTADTQNSNLDNHVFNVAVIGSGLSGLVSAKRSIDYGYNVTVYEQTEQIGGIWFYTNETGKDKYGVNIHTAMYQNLRANSPYQTMELSGFRFPTNATSYPPHAEVLSYIHSYADHFEVKKYIKLSHQVIRVLPIENEKWEIIVKNLPGNTFETHIYDAVFVCNGHFSKPFHPNIPGLNKFTGKIIHSHDFRTAEAYRKNSVLVIGGGNSGKDIVQHVLKTASRVTLSRHKRPNETQAERLHEQWLYSEEVTIQDDVVCFTSTGATFIDGSHQTFDAVILATGYNYSFPFLSADAGIHVENKLVQPLYKHIFNINHPTMVFINEPYNMIITMFDLQVRYALKFISGAKKLPSKYEMLEEVRKNKLVCYIEKLEGCDRSVITNIREYAKSLSDEAEIERLPPVLLLIIFDSKETHSKEPLEFRKYKYIIIDDETFRKEKCQNYC